MLPMNVMVLGGVPDRRHAVATALVDRARHARADITIVDELALSGLCLLLAGGPEDTTLRETLARAGLAYSVLYGDAAQQAAAAWALLAPLVGVPASATEPSPRAGPIWRCEKCSDPECEHRLFRDLLARRGASGAY